MTTTDGVTCGEAGGYGIEHNQTGDDVWRRTEGASAILNVPCWWAWKAAMLAPGRGGSDSKVFVAQS
jgi:hypothetical protein